MTLADRFTARYRGLREPLRSERRLELLLLGFGLAALLQCLWLGWRSLSPPTLEAVVPSAAGLRAAEPLEAAQLEASQRLELRSRPLFWVSRRPQEEQFIEVAEEPAAESAQTRAAAAPLRDLVLNGVFGGADSGGAIVTYRGDTQRLRLGDELDGWTLIRAGDGAAVFDSAGVEDVRGIAPLPVVAGASGSGTAMQARRGATAASSSSPSRVQAGPASSSRTPATATPQPRSLSAGGLSLGGVSDSPASDSPSTRGDTRRNKE